MKKKIFAGLCIIGIISTILISSMTAFLTYHFLVRQLTNELQNECNLIATVLDFYDDYSFLSSLQSSSRITIIQPDGTVTYDSLSNINEMENHNDRIEVSDSLQKGFGESKRQSVTLDTTSYYYAKLLENGTVLRVSKNSDSVFIIFYTTVAGFMIAAIVSLILCIILSSKLTQNIIFSLEKISYNLDNIAASDQLIELYPFVKKIKEQKHTIHAQMNDIKSEKDMINTITENMKEGLIVVDNKRNIISVNKSAIHFLGVKESLFIGKNLIALSRNAKILNCVDSSLLGSHHDEIISIQNKYCRFFSSAIVENNKVKGAIILILDVTQAHKSEKIRREFSSNVSHELKTPLTSISGFSEMIVNDMVVDHYDIKLFAEKIQQEAGRMLSLIDDIIRVSEIEDTVVFKKEMIDLYQITKEILPNFDFIASQKQVCIVLTGTTCFVDANARMMRELVSNLIDNAIKYNNIGGSVQITIKKQKKQTVFTIVDTGIGISQNHQDRIFERFYRVDKSRSKQTGGTGLGLAIVKHIIEYHNGKITLTSEENNGTTIVVKI